MKYLKIKKWLIELAQKPEARDKLPSVRQICREFNVSQAPVSRAIQELKFEGIITSKDRSGLIAVSPGNLIEPKVNKKNNSTIVFAFINFFTERIWQQEHILTQLSLTNNYSLSCYRSDKGDNFRGLPGFIRNLQENIEVHAVILNPASEVLEASLLEELGGFGVSVVLNDCIHDYRLGAPFFITRADPIDLGRSAIEYLVRMGHKKIGVVRCEPNSDLISQSNKAMRNIIKEAGFKKKDLYLISDTIHHWDSPYVFAQDLTERSLALIKSENITALVYHSSGGAFAALQTLHENGLRVPDDISVLGFGEYSFAEYTIPALTVCTCDYHKMIEDAFNLAVENISTAKRRWSYKHKIIERGSVSDINALT